MSSVNENVWKWKNRNHYEQADLEKLYINSNFKLIYLDFKNRININRLTWRGAQCYCPTGQKPAGTSCVDTNECENNVCDQICQVGPEKIFVFIFIFSFVIQFAHVEFYPGHCRQLHLLLCARVCTKKYDKKYELGHTLHNPKNSM